MAIRYDYFVSLLSKAGPNVVFTKISYICLVPGPPDMVVFEQFWPKINGGLGCF